MLEYVIVNEARCPRVPVLSPLLLARALWPEEALRAGARYGNDICAVIRVAPMLQMQKRVTDLPPNASLELMLQRSLERDAAPVLECCNKNHK